MNDIIETAKEFDIDAAWAIDRRKAYLSKRISELRKESGEIVQLLPGAGELERYLLLDRIRFLNDEIKRYENELSFKRSRRVEITRGQIDKARWYPIENFLPNVKNGKTNCINHTDERPSMDVRNNFAYCYSCGWSGDAIAVYMKTHSCDFITAVKFLAV